MEERVINSRGEDERIETVAAEEQPAEDGKS
jgi:hypothetical protein